MEVEGNRAEPYHVRLAFDEGRVSSAHCTCGYSFEGWRKPIVATLLVCLRQPAIVAERSPRVADWPSSSAVVAELVNKWASPAGAVAFPLPTS